MKSMLWIYLGLAAVAMIWGANFGVARWSMNYFSPEVFAFLRFGLAVPILFIILKLKEGHVRMPGRDMWKLMLIGFIGVTVLEIAVMYTIKFTTLANASLLNVAPWPIFAALFSPLFAKESISGRLVTGGIFTMIGVVLVIAGGEESLSFRSEQMLGNVMAVGVSIFGALFNLACMPLMKRYSALRVSSWFILFGALFMFPFTLGSWSQTQWTQLDTIVWVAIFYNVVFCTVAAFIIWNFCMNHAGATRSNFFRYVVPATAVLVGFIFYKEAIQITQLFGGLLIVTGLVWISLEKRKAVIPMVELTKVGK